jgi:transcriptional regulator with XRE-family HTH domain
MKQPDLIDQHVGRRIRMRRVMIGMSQAELGDRLNLTFQQVQKYERGVNRVGASKLHTICRALDVPVSFMFEGLPGAAGVTGLPLWFMDFLGTPAGQRIAAAIGLIDDPDIREKFAALIESVAARIGKKA